MTPRNLTNRLSARNQGLVALILLAILQICNATNPAKDDYHEDLYLRPLADGKLFAHFQFTTLYRKDIKSLRWENKIDIFPLSVADLVATTDLNELHFSLTKGNWNHKSWGYPVRSSPTGAQIRAKFSQHNEGPSRSWQRLVNSLAGKFCASLASADRKTLVETKFSLDHQLSPLSLGGGSSLHSNASSEGSADSGHGHHSSVGGGQQKGGARNRADRVFYSNLPEETMCTENLTPWKKLLPCYSSSGLASLLNAVHLLKSSYSSLAMDLEPRACLDADGEPLEGCQQVLLTQSMTVVFNPLLVFEGRQSWSLAKMFGQSVAKLCPLASHSRVHVDTSELDDKNKLYPQTFEEYSLQLSATTRRHYATFDLQSIIANETSTPNAKSAFNLGIKQNKLFKGPAYTSRPSIPVHLRTHIAGLGTADGTIVATVKNALSEPLRITYMDVVPHFMRVYLHTLTVRTSSGQEVKPDRLNFVLSQEDTPTLIEFSLVLPAQSETQISYDFERAFLRWTDFKPDANKGVLLGSAMIGVPLHRVDAHLVMPLCASSRGRVTSASLSLLNTDKANSTTSASPRLLQLVELDDEMLHVYARPLLVILPTPDFSMPYNVLCLVSTVLVAAFGPIHNMTTRKPVIKVSKKSLLEKSRRQTKTEQDEEQQRAESDK